MSFTPTMPSDFLHLVTMHLPERDVVATIDWHLYGPAWTGGIRSRGPAAAQHAACRLRRHLQHHQLPRSAGQSRRGGLNGGRPREPGHLLATGRDRALDAVTPGASGSGTT